RRSPGRRPWRSRPRCPPPATARRPPGRCPRGRAGRRSTDRPGRGRRPPSRTGSRPGRSAPRRRGHRNGYAWGTPANTETGDFTRPPAGRVRYAARSGCRALRGRGGRGRGGRLRLGLRCRLVGAAGIGLRLVATIARQVPLLLAVLLEVGLVPAAARQAELRGRQAAPDLVAAALGALRRIGVGKLLQAVEAMAAGGTLESVDGHGKARYRRLRRYMGTSSGVSRPRGP